MQTTIYIILSIIIALALALFQYVYKARKHRLNWLFTILRTLTYLGILLLLVNPKFTKNTYYTEKPNLVIAVDNSESVAHLKQNENARKALKSISNNQDLSDKFNISIYNFGKDVFESDSLSFAKKQTNISKTLGQLNSIYKTNIAPVVLISDGNQTYGDDYVFASKNYKQSVYPVILGDTITYTDLKIEQLNVNKYAYLKNKFPVEVIATYNGNTAVKSRLVVTLGKSTVFSKAINFSKQRNSEIVNFNLPANSVGVKSYRVSLIPLDSEKNKINNSKNFAVEVIDQKTNVAIVSEVIHPDLGALKKSIESNNQRKVTFLKPNEASSKLNDFQLVILYQPTAKFKSVYKTLKDLNKNRLVITGTKTDVSFLNSVTEAYKQVATGETEEYQPLLNSNYSTFIIDGVDFESFPPLLNEFGEVVFNTTQETMLFKTVDGYNVNEPLLATFEIDNRREAVLFGENIWRWRAQSFLSDKAFNNFDNIIGKLVQYLASNKRKNRLNVEFQSFYQGNDNVVIKAQFFNKNYEFDASETLHIILKNKDTGETKTLPLVLKNNNYQVDLSNLSAGEYSFTIKASRENISKSGSFKILEYNIEQQFLNADVTKLQTLATNTNGTSAFVDNTSVLINNLLDDERYKAIQKNEKKIVPLIDFKYLLALIALTLTLEWFIRKYNGLT